MSTFVLLLAAELAPGDGPEKVSGEVAEGRLHLDGKWEGYWYSLISSLYDPVYLDNGEIRRRYPGEAVDRSFGTVFVEGKRNLRLVSARRTQLGIYHQEGDCFKICVHYGVGPRPTGFGDHPDWILFVFRRVPPGK
jgi:hypothetical protein